MENNESMVQKATRASLSRAQEVAASPYALKYHITAPSGWINDPNGLIRMNGRYHVFFQHHPYSAQPGPMHWGHVSGTDLAHWERMPVALAPDMPYERGCFSGTAVDDDGVLTLIYTAHDETHPLKERQCIARSYDGGVTFEKSPLNPVIGHFPEGCCGDFRDPKVWKQDGLWHMICGTIHNDKLGCIVHYTGKTLDSWEYQGVFCESDGTMGFMWECPSFCRIDGQEVIITSPIGIPGHKSIAIFGSFDASTGKFTMDHWHEVDLGEAFYAAQAFDDGDRTLLFGWMCWGDLSVTQKDGWAGTLTLPRELHVRGGRLYQIPAPELALLRGKQLLNGADASALESLTGNTMELNLADFKGDFILTDSEGELLHVSMKDNHVHFTVRDGEDGDADGDLLNADNGVSLRVFIDRSTAELFFNDGEMTYSTRIFPKDGHLHCRVDGSAKVTAWEMESAFPEATC